MRNEKPCACLSISTGVRARRSASTKCRDRKWEKMRNGKGNQLSQFHAKVSLLFTGFITFGWNGNNGPLVIQYRSNQLLLMTLRLVKVANWIAIKRPIIHCHNSMKFRLNLDGALFLNEWFIVEPSSVNKDSEIKSGLWHVSHNYDAKQQRGNAETFGDLSADKFQQSRHLASNSIKWRNLRLQWIVSFFIKFF